MVIEMFVLKGCRGRANREGGEEEGGRREGRRGEERQEGRGRRCSRRTVRSQSIYSKILILIPAF